MPDLSKTPDKTKIAVSVAYVTSLTSFVVVCGGRVIPVLFASLSTASAAAKYLTSLDSVSDFWKGELLTIDHGNEQANVDALQQYCNATCQEQL